VYGGIYQGAAKEVTLWYRYLFTAKKLPVCKKQEYYYIFSFKYCGLIFMYSTYVVQKGRILIRKDYFGSSRRSS
jgi:hypothetical protein